LSYLLPFFFFYTTWGRRDFFRDLIYLECGDPAPLCISAGWLFLKPFSKLDALPFFAGAGSPADKAAPGRRTPNSNDVQPELAQ